MTDILIIDFETKSRVDLAAAGGDNYASDPSTDILCFAAAPYEDRADEADLYLDWAPGDGPLPIKWQAAVVKHLRKGGLIAAHNARFDQLIWECVAREEYLFPEIPTKNWYCSMAQCRVNAIPASLDNAARALDTPHKKNKDGNALIRYLCIPDKVSGQFNTNAEKLKRFRAYCVDDVLATRDVMKACRMLSPAEHEDWLASERVNDHGIRIDRELATLATQCAEVEAEALGHELSQLTIGAVTKATQHQRIAKWILPRLTPDVEKLTVVYKDGVRKNSLAKDIRTGILDRADEGLLDISDEAYNVLAVLDEGSRSSVSKFRAMVDRATPDTDRVHGAFIYAGAATLRYTSRGLQLHNMRRDAASPKEAEDALRLLRSGRKPTRYNVMDALSKLLRPALIPDEGKVFVVGDWKAIENRCLPWLTDDPRAEKKLDVFRAFDAAFRCGEKTTDTYEVAAADAGTDDRQVGKVIELSLGFGGANGAFNSMAKNYGVFLPDNEVTRIVKNWRRANPWAQDFWHGLERAARRAIRAGEGAYGKIKYFFIPELMGGSLLCEMPGGHFITYPKARIQEIEGRDTITALKANWTPAADDKEWPRFKLWGGLLAENVTQAFAAALLRNAIKQTEHVALHCHDELALEVPEKEAQAASKQLQKVMEQAPEWATGLPLLAPPSIMKRYGK